MILVRVRLLRRNENELSTGNISTTISWSHSSNWGVVYFRSVGQRHKNEKVKTQQKVKKRKGFHMKKTHGYHWGGVRQKSTLGTYSVRGLVVKAVKCLFLMLSIVIDCFLGLSLGVMSVFIMTNGKIGSVQFIRPWVAWAFVLLCIVGIAANQVMFAKVYNARITK